MLAAIAPAGTGSMVTVGHCFKNGKVIMNGTSTVVEKVTQRGSYPTWDLNHFGTLFLITS